MPGARYYQAAPPPDGDPSAVRAGAHGLSGIGDHLDGVARDLGLATAALTEGPGSWQGSGGEAFVTLADSLRNATTESAHAFRELAGSLTELANELDRAQERRNEANAVSAAFMLLLIGDVIQAGVDVPEDAATVAAAGAAGRLTVEATEIASAGAARAAINFARLTAALTLRGLSGFAASHVGAAVVAGGQTALIDWITTGEIDWKSVGVNAFIAGLLTIPIARLGRLNSTVVVDEKAAQQGAEELNAIAKDPQLADEAAVASNAATQPSLTFASGYDAERYLQVAVGGRKQVTMLVGEGLAKRRVDVLVSEDGTVAFESKVGYTSLDSRVESEIERDKMLLEQGKVDEYFWVFGRSAKTGKIGASKQLLEKLDEAGIKYTTFDDIAA